MKNLSKITKIIAVGSVDGVLTSAAVLRYVCENYGKNNVDVIFTQAFTVDKITDEQLGENETFCFVDLAVNNQNREMTTKFLDRISSLNGKVLAIIDEHNATDWYHCMSISEMGISGFTNLEIKPVSQNECKIKSSGALFFETCWEGFDEQMFELCHDADCADHMDFSGKYATIVNRAIKANISDDSMRVFLAEFYARFPYQQTNVRIFEACYKYDQILSTHKEILNNRIDIHVDYSIRKAEIIRVDCVGKVIDMTTLMSQIYKLGVKIAIIEGEYYNKELGKKTRMISYGVRPGVDFNVLEALQMSGIPCNGFAQKANILPEYENLATEIIIAKLYM